MSIAPALVPRDDLTVTHHRRAVRWWVPVFSLATVGAVVARGVLGGVGVVEQAVVWAGSTSWTAWFFGTLDPAAATAVGAPAAGWIPALAARLGAPPVGVAVALTVLAVGVGALAVRRSAGRGAGLTVAGILALVLPVNSAHATPALFLALAGYALSRRRALVAGVALGVVVLSAGWAGVVAVLVAVLFAGRWVPGLRVLGGAGLVVGAWCVVAWGWPGAHPEVSWWGAATGVFIPLAAVVGVLAVQWVWASRPRARVLLGTALAVATLVWVPRVPVSPEVGSATSNLLSTAGTTWSAAAAGPAESAALELASGTSVLTTDDLTLAGFQSYVATGRVHYLVADGVSSEIVDWVAEDHTATTVDGTTVYDLTD